MQLLAVSEASTPGKCDLGTSKTPVAETPQAFFLHLTRRQRAGWPRFHSATTSALAVGVWVCFRVSISIISWIDSNCVLFRVLTWRLTGVAPTQALFLATMGPKLRSSSRPSTPFDTPSMNTTRPSSAADSSRPRKLRRTGHNSRVASDPPQGSQSQLEQFMTEADDDSQAPQTGWVEPPLRAAVPSYMDSPWSAMSSDTNPVLSTMRPLGSMPTAADLRKVGLEPSKPVNNRTPAKEAPQIMQNGVQDHEQDAEDNADQNGEEAKKEKSADVPAEEPTLTPAPASPKNGSRNSDHLATFAALPVPSSTEFDVDRIKGAIEDALRKGLETGNRAVIRALLNVWENTSKDSSMLSILDGMCRDNPSRRDTSAFKTVIRSAWDEFQAEDDSEGSDAQPPAMTRTHSASSVSSLSSAKSLDAESFAPVMTPATSNTRSRTKGKQAKTIAPKAKTKASTRRSMFPSSAEASTQRKRTVENDPEFSEEAIRTKRARLQQEIPDIEIPESKVRGSLTSSNIKYSGPARTFGSRAVPNGVTMNGTGPSDSRESSEAPDNRRLTPSYVLPPTGPKLKQQFLTFDSDDEYSENNDFCHNCTKSGQLLCCDGCVKSFHFSCLEPPLDPANPPEGEWFCPKCSINKPMRKLLGTMDHSVQQQDFMLPFEIRDYFAGVTTEKQNGRYEAVGPSFPRIAPRNVRGSRLANYSDPNLRRLYEKLPNATKETPIFCMVCGKTALHDKPIIQCDYCPCSFHLDCTDPITSNPPIQTSAGREHPEHGHKYWLCPNHVYHDLAYVFHDQEGYDHHRRIRSVKRPRLVDVEILPDEDDEEALLKEITHGGEKYRVSERGIKLSFIEKVKRYVELFRIRTFFLFFFSN